jgi:hypothetical protein
VPRGDWAAQRGADARMQGGGAAEAAQRRPAGAGPGGGGVEEGGGYALSTLQGAAVLADAGAPRLRLSPAASLAESIVLRGALLDGPGPGGAANGGGGGDEGGGEQGASVAAAAAALDEALRREPPRRCVVHRCVAAPPLAVPLPFPGVFGPAVGRRGGVVRGWSPAGAAGGGGGGGGHHVVSCPALTRVAATEEFAPWLRARAAGLAAAARSPAGRAAAGAWGLGGGELDEARERLEQLAGSYSEDGGGSSGEEG